MLFAYKGKHYCCFYFLFKFERKHTICIFIESPAEIPSWSDAARPGETLNLSLGQSGLQLLGTSGRRARVVAPHPGGRRPPELRLSLPLACPYPPDTSGSAQKLKPRRDGCLRHPIISISLAHRPPPSARGSSRPATPPSPACAPLSRQRAALPVQRTTARIFVFNHFGKIESINGSN